ncbi:MAG: hypothetical protein CVV45_09330 [Spirochaetae bacterium HGW-Spirochaetae-10]|nr:MAG: hypothetical protein CVV45_09330 [Spirochaetae bacterium HGW-Spirochaetae-10]
MRSRFGGNVLCKAREVQTLTGLDNWKKGLLAVPLSNNIRARKKIDPPTADAVRMQDRFQA